MKLRSMIAAALAGIVAISATTYAADAPPPADKPAAKADDVKGVRLVKPYSDLKDLTADQTQKLKEIHKKYLDQIKALEAQQKEKMAAVLTDAQKREVADAPAAKPKKPAGKVMKDDPATPAPAAPKDAAKTN